MKSQLAHQLVDELSPPQEKKLLTREGKEVNISGDIWQLPYSTQENYTLKFNTVINPSMRIALKAYVEKRLKQISTHAGGAVFYDVRREIFRYWKEEKAKGNTVEAYLIELFELAINRTRARRKLERVYRPIQWYIWCAENCPENGFSEAYAQELEALEIPDGSRGEAVRMEDPVSGPLHKSLELPLLISALKSDESKEIKHLQQKVVVALSIAFGRNSANLTSL